MRAVFEALGADVNYKSGQIEARRGQQHLTLRPGDNRAKLNGQTLVLDAAPRVWGGTTYVPLRFVAQALNEEVQWDSQRRRVVVGSGQVAATTGPVPDLKRLVVGNQGGVLKLWDRNKSQVAYYRGIDDRSVAPLSSQDQTVILAELALNGRVDESARRLMREYSSLPKKETLALLGVFNSLDGSSEIQSQTAREIRSFLARVMRQDRQVANRRQAVLALAVGNGLEPAVTDAVLDFYHSSENLWETFPVQQFFEYQAHRLRQSSDFPNVRSRALAVNSLYRDNIASYLR